MDSKMNYSAGTTLPVDDPKMSAKKASATGATRENFKTWLTFLKRNQPAKKSGKDVYTGVPTGNERLSGDELDADAQLLRILLLTGIGHLVIGCLGVIVLAALGAAATGGILTGWSFCCAIAALLVYGSLRWIPRRQRSRLLPQMSDSQLKGYIKVYILMTAASIVLAIATAIQGTVVLSQYAGASPFYVFNGFVQFIPTFLYVGLGAGNLGLGVIAIIVDAVLISKLYRYLMELRRLNPKEKAATNATSYREDRPPPDHFAREITEEYSDCTSPPPSYHSNHSELKEEVSSEGGNEVQFAFFTYAQYLDFPVEDQWSTTSSALQRMETKL